MTATLPDFRKEVEKAVGAYIQSLPSDSLFEPMRYILSLGGKRIRPALVLLATDAFGSSVKNSIPAALAVEIFHNFSLVHDDIMDEAPLRRNKPTVHTKWDDNTGILSGDAMLIEAYKQLQSYQGKALADLFYIFNKTAMEVCVGQRMDMDFEATYTVDEEQYIEMIGLKTAVLLGCSLQMGAIIAGASEEDRTSIYEFGKAAGIGFQLQDDYLDAFGDPETFGKQVGGDIIANKMTYLIIRAREKADINLSRELNSIYFEDGIKDPELKVERVREIFRNLEVDRDIREKSQEYFRVSADLLSRMNISDSGKKNLLAFLGMLKGRKS